MSLVCGSLDGHELEDRGLHGVQRGEHPGDRPRPRVGIVREQTLMVLGDVEDDRARLEQGEIAFLIGRDQPKRMKAGSVCAWSETRRTS